MNGFIKLRISGHGLDTEEITKELSCMPDFVCSEGDSYTPKYGGTEAAAYKEDCWLSEMQKDENETFDSAIEKFVLKFADSATYLKELSDKADITLWISAYPHEEQTNIHLSPKTIRLVSDMGICIDFNVLFLKEFYDGNL